MKKFLLLLVMICALSMAAGPAGAVGLSLNQVGATSSFDLVVSGLGDFTSPSLGAFSMLATFNPALLTFNSASYGDPILGDLLNQNGLALYDTAAGLNYVYLSETSFDDPATLDAVQPASFTLATITFTGTEFGSLGLANYTLSDEWGFTIASVPEPATLLLLIAGLPGFAYFRKVRTIA